MGVRKGLVLSSPTVSRGDRQCPSGKKKISFLITNISPPILLYLTGLILWKLLCPLFDLLNIYF